MKLAWTTDEWTVTLMEQEIIVICTGPLHCTKYSNSCIKCHCIQFLHIVFLLQVFFKYEH